MNLCLCFKRDFQLCKRIKKNSVIQNRQTLNLFQQSNNNIPNHLQIFYAIFLWVIAYGIRTKW